LGVFPLFHVEIRFAHVFLVVPFYLLLLFLFHSFDQEELDYLRRIFSPGRFKAG